MIHALLCVEESVHMVSQLPKLEYTIVWWLNHIFSRMHDSLMQFNLPTKEKTEEGRTLAAYNVHPSKLFLFFFFPQVTSVGKVGRDQLNKYVHIEPNSEITHNYIYSSKKYK